MKKKVVLPIGIAVIVAVTVTGGYFGYQSSHSQTRSQVLTAYMKNIEKHDYNKMYEMLDDQSKSYIKKKAFIKRNQKIYEGIEAKDIKIKVTRDEKSKAVQYDTDMKTAAGDLNFKNQASFTKKDGTYYLQWDDEIIFPDLLKGDTVKVATVAAERGNILDREGSLLAGKGQVSSVGLVPEKMSGDPSADLQKLSDLLQIPVETIQKKLDENWVTPGSFVPVKKIRKISPLVSQEELQQSSEAALQQELIAIPGVMISDADDRVYPLGEKASLLVGYIQDITAEDLKEYSGEGYTAQSKIGKSGLETLYEDRLHGRDGCKIWIADKNGDNKETLVSREVKNGEDIRTTIDSNLQSRIYDSISGDQGTGVAMNPYTGEILALVSVPGYDDNDFILGMSEQKWKELNDDPAQPLYNRFRASWVPGSSLKPVVAGIGLSTGTLNADEDLGPSVLNWKKDDSWGNYEITTTHTYDGPSNLQNALIYSDNIYFAKAALKIGRDTFTSSLEKLGFGQDIPFDIVMKHSQYANKGEELNSEVTLADSGYGQGQMLVNPLHMAGMYSAFANGGDMIKPKLEFCESPTPENWVEGAFTPEAANTVKDDMIQVVENPEGSGHAVKMDDISLAGKTGTAEIKASKEDTGGTELGWFDVFTADQNQDAPILLITMIQDVKDRGGSSYVVEKTKPILQEWFEN